MRIFLRIVLVVAALVVGAWYFLQRVGPEPLPEYELSGQTMGTSYRVIVASSDESELAGLGRRIQAHLDNIESRYSTWNDESELSRLNMALADEWHPVTEDLCETLRQALHVSRQSDGAFDPTVGRLVELWGFASNKDPETLPEQSAIDAAIVSTGYRRVQTDCENSSVRKHGNVSIDLSGYVKGLAADRIVRLLHEAGYYAVLAEVGGEVATLRSNRSLGWRVAIETPGMPGAKPLDTVRLYSQGIATSGDYQNYYEVDGVRYSHVINPATGRPVRHSTVSVTVVADSSADADAWATALLVMGSERGLAAAERNAIAALFVDRTGNELTTASSTSFDRVFR